MWVCLYDPGGKNTQGKVDKKLIWINFLLKGQMTSPGFTFFPWQSFGWDKPFSPHFNFLVFSEGQFAHPPCNGVRINFQFPLHLGKKRKLTMKSLRDSVALVWYVVLLCLADKNLNKSRPHFRCRLLQVYFSAKFIFNSPSSYGLCTKNGLYIQMFQLIG